MNILRWFLSFIGVQLLCLVVWFVGPLAPQLEEPLPRIGIIAFMAAAWAIGNLALDLRRLSRERSLTAGVAGGKPEDAEAAALQEKLGAAMTTLRKARGKRGALYEQPWYVIIGPPGAGKTTALLNAGLEFPLAEQMGRGALAGVGGTRLCEWWFTDKAVLIDTAGRYTTHDSDAAVDRAGWEAFLALLKRTRPKQPLNGIIVAIALADVVGDSAGADRLLHARAIRRRIVELETKLGVRLPVYALLTKSDLLAGFTEFFGDLDREGREQVWGITLPYRKGAVQDAVAAFSAEAKRWVGVLEQRMLARLQSEPNADRRALVSAFPAQFATVGAPVAEFLGEAFAPHERERPPLLRGVYLTSATQEGTPIDRLTGALARAFGVEGGQAKRLRPEEGRTFFLAGLLRDVIFREAMLGSASGGTRRRSMILRSVGFASCLLIAAAGGLLLWHQRESAAAEVDRVQKNLAAYEQEAGALPLDPVRDADLPRLLPLLDHAQGLAGRAEGSEDEFLYSLGLSQRGKLNAAADAVYRHGLEFTLLPRLLWRLEAQIRGNLSDPDFEYEATRVYLMLGSAGPLDRDLVRQWLSLDWEQSYTPEIRAGLERHLDALLRNPLPKIGLDGQVVAAAQATFNRVSVAQRVYSRIKPSAAASRLAPWRLSDALGAAGVAVFVRASGRPLTDSIPGFFSPAGFHEVLLPALGPALKAVAAESWVLGAKTDLQSDAAAIAAAEQDVIKLYTADYIQAWDGMLGDLDVAPLRSLTQAAQDLYILASRENSPIRRLLASVVQQTTMSAAAPAAPGTPTERERLAALLGRQGPAADTASPVQAIDDHYKPLRELMRPGAIEQVLKPMSDLQQQLAKMAASANKAGGTTDPGSADPAVALQAEALRQPQPLARWLASIAASGRALRGGGVKEQITAAFKAGGGVGALCPQVVSGKYPFTAGSDKEVGLDEFGRLFGAGGVLDAFFNTQLKPYVDTSGKVWKLQPVEGVSAPIAPADLQQFQTAQTIRAVFFSGGGTAPKIRFDLTPLGVEPAGGTASLDAGSATVQAGAGAPRPAQIVWPAPNGTAAKLSFAPPGGSTGLQESGAWALFRLMARGQFAPAGSDRTTVVLRDGDHSAKFEMRVAVNPFTTRLLQDFKCPSLQ